MPLSHHVLFAGGGNDTIEAGAGDDQVYGQGGDDIIIAGQGGNNLYDGGGGNDTINVTLTTAAGLINGGDGNDTLRGLGGNDLLQGGLGADRLIDTAGRSLLDGGAGIDTLSYATSTAGVTVNLSNSALNAGGDAQGDSPQTSSECLALSGLCHPVSECGQAV